MIGNSDLIIRAMIKNQRHACNSMSQVFVKMSKGLKGFENVEFYHVLITLNRRVDKHANNARRLN
jgi:hypothetical protein